MRFFFSAAVICLTGHAVAATPYGVGRNDYSPLGDGTVVFRSVPSPVLSEPDRLPLSGVSAIAAGSYNSVLVKTDGSAWICGGAENISFGVGTTPRPVLARQILEAPGGATFAGVIAADCGTSHQLLLKADGTVWSFGGNAYGELGNGSTVSRTDPSPVLVSAGGAPMTNVASIAVGSYHSVFLKTDGTVWACGDNYAGQLGDGTTTNRSVPIQILEAPGGVPFVGVLAVAARGSHTILLKTDGTIWTMGANSSGQLGDGTTSARSSPVQVLESPGGPPFTGVTAVRAANRHSVLLKFDGSVWAMGSNGNGQLGDGTALNRTTPVQVLEAPGGSAFTGAAQIGAGNDYTLLVRNDGSAWAWGLNLYAQLGDGSVTDRNVPVPVKAPGGELLGGVAKVAGSLFHSLFLKSDGTVLAAGWNSSGQLGDGVLQHHATSPVAMRTAPDGPAMRNVISVAAGKVHALILKADGSLWSTGNNGHGQLGNGPIRNSQQHITPGPVLTAEGGPQVTDVIAIAAGTYHSVFVKSDGSLWTLGENEGRQLGDGTVTDRAYPVAVLSAAGGPQVTGVTAVAAGHLHTVFLKNDGSPWAVGSNGYGQLGNNSFSSSYFPVRIRNSRSSGYLSSLPNDVVAIAAGTYHTMFLRKDGSAWWAGRNSLGASSEATRVMNASSPTFSGVSAIAAGSFHGMFLLNDSSLWTMGLGLSGELGRGINIAHSAAPVLTGPGGQPVTGVASVAASVKPDPDSPFPNEAHTAYIKTDGTVWITGGNSYGQLGNGSTAKSDYPVQLNTTPAGAPVTGATMIAAGTYNSMYLVSEGDTYSTWLADEAPSLSGASKLTGADPDQDSIPNLIEYILGSQASQPDVDALPAATYSHETQSLELTFTRIATSNNDSILYYEHSTDLSHWSSVEIDAFSTPAGVTLGTPDANGHQTVAITLPSAETNRFLRLKAKLR